MRGIALSLAAVLSLGVAVAGGRATAADRAAHNRLVADPEAPATSSAGRVWYGGTLPPIIVVAAPPEKSATRQAVSCPPVGG